MADGYLSRFFVGMFSLVDGADKTRKATVSAGGALSTADAELALGGRGFSVAVTPTVTSGVYGSGDIMGGLLTFADVAQAIDRPFLLQTAEVNFLSAVTPSLTLHLFNADPTATTKTDNEFYSLNAADAFKRVCSLPFSALGASFIDHGTPNSYSLFGLARPLKPVSGTRLIYGLLVDATGVTLTSVADLQIRIGGVSL